MECARRLFSHVGYFSALLSGHFLFVWIVRVSSQHGDPRVTGFRLWCLGYKRNVLRGGEAEAADFLRSYLNHTVSLLSHSVGPSWSQDQPRLMGRGKRKKRKNSGKNFSYLLIHLKVILLFSLGISRISQG